MAARFVPPARRRFATLALGALVFGATGCSIDRNAALEILEARIVRDPDGRVAIDLSIEAIEQSGKNVGTYCVSAHFMPIGFATNTFEAPRYNNELDFVQLCASDLEDGDRRAFRLVSNRTDLPPLTPVRVQARLARVYFRAERVAP